MTVDSKDYRVSWDAAAGVARIEWLPGAICGLETARLVDVEIQDLGRGPVPTLVDMREVASIDRPARHHFIDNHLNYRAVAMVTGSAATRMLAYFFLGMKRGDIPVRIFTDEAEAVAWLQAQA